MRVYFLCHFYLPYIKRFSNEEDEQIPRQHLIMKYDIRHVAALTCMKRLIELQRFCQQLLASFFLFSVSQLGGFLIDQMKFICWTQGTAPMSLQRCYNISDVEGALQSPYYSQLWQVNC